MKFALYIFTFILAAQSLSFAGEITRGVPEAAPKISIGNANVASPTDISAILSSSEKDLQYMLDHYSDTELRNFAISLNNAQIIAAKQNNLPIPQKLSKETLNNREKIANYLRSLYDYKY